MGMSFSVLQGRLGLRICLGVLVDITTSWVIHLQSNMYLNKSSDDSLCQTDLLTTMCPLSASREIRTPNMPWSSGRYYDVMGCPSQSNMYFEQILR